MEEKGCHHVCFYRGPSDPYEPVTEWDFGDDEVPAREDDNAEEEDDNVEEEDDNVEEENEYLRNPEPQNEHVGVNDEAVYLDIVQPKALQVV